MLVVFRHALHMFSVYSPDAATYKWITEHLSFFLNGWVGVDLFFTISGFLISRPFIYNDQQSIKSYFIRRGLRIIPAYYFVMILCLVGFFPAYTSAIPEGEYFKTILYHMLFLQDYLPSNINIVFWSLGSEEKFYILAPILVSGIIFLSRKNNKTYYLIILLLLVMSLISRITSYYFAGMPSDYAAFFISTRSPFHCCLDPFLFGVGIAFFEKYNHQKKLDLKKSAEIVFIISLVLLMALMAQGYMLENINFYSASLQPFLISLAMAGLVWSGVMGGIPKKLSVSPIRYLSRISYSLYLIHLPLWPLTFLITLKIFGIQCDYSSILFFTSLYLILSLGLSSLLYYFVEAPFLKLREKF